MQQDETTAQVIPPSAGVLVVVLLASALTLLTALAGIVAGFVSQSYFLGGFEIVVAIATVIGIFTGMGKFNEGPSIAIACVAGSIATCSVLAYLSIEGELFIGGRIVGKHAVLLGMDVFPILAFRLAISTLLAGCAGYVLLERTPRRSIRYLLLSAALGLPLVAAALIIWRVPVAVGVFRSMHILLQALFGSIGVLIGIALFSTCIHCLIRAFQVGVEAADPHLQGREKTPSSSSDREQSA